MVADADDSALYEAMDDAYDQADNALLDPGSDGLITAQGGGLLQEMARRREQGASLDQLRRDAGEIDGIRVSNAVLERAIAQGRRLNEWQSSGTIRDHSKRFHGVTVVACEACGRRVLLRALRPTGCAVCQG